MRGDHDAPPAAPLPDGPAHGEPQPAQSAAVSLSARLHALLRRDFLVGGIPPRYFVTRWIFLRLLAVVHLLAFLSLWVQVDGLIGSRGIAPANLLLSLARARTGVERYWRLPTLCWLNDSDWFLHLLCGSGVVFAFFLFLGYAPPLCLAALYILYLSLVSVSPDFLSFQWDSLLLETTFLAIFFAPRHWRPNLSKEVVHSRVVLLLLRWLLFRLMFTSGLVKLEDATWRNLTALNYHFETQPLPTVIGWYAHHLPEWILKASVAGMFAMELVVPFLVLAPRRIRGVSAAALIAFQLLIMATGNYAFFNILTIALCLLLLDDLHWKAMMPKRLFAWMAPPDTIRRLPRYRKVIMGALAVPIILITGIQMAQLLPNSSGPPEWMWSAMETAYPYRVANRYGLFAHMTTSREEIVIEGSDNGFDWKPYIFKYKPGPIDRPPRIVAPHQPRLDWQMWFVALRGSRPPSWFGNLCYRLLQGEPDVLSLLESNPFPDKPPKQIRAMRYGYQFTSIDIQRRSGVWWLRTPKGQYMRPIDLSDAKSE